MIEPDFIYTLEDYWTIVEQNPHHKYEYVDGHIRMMSRGTTAHAQITMNVGGLLHAALRKSECNVYSPDATVLLTGQRVYCPDVTVSCDPHDWTRKNALESPNVVVEVISPSTEKIDRLEKLPLYHQYPTILEILLVDSRKRFVEHHHRIGVSAWQLIIYEQEEEIIDLSSIDVQLSVRDIYEKVYLELEEAKLE